MPFLKVDDLTVDAHVDEASVEDASVEYYNRAVSDDLEGTTYSVKKSYQFTTPLMTMAEARAYEGWIRGRRHYWSFNNGPGSSSATNRFNRNADGAGLAFTGGTLATRAWVPTYGWTLSVHAAATASAQARFGSESDWTLAFSATAASSNGNFGAWKSYAVTCSSGFIQSFEEGASVATVRMMTLTAASGSLTLNLLGKNQQGTACTAVFSAVSMCPFAYNQAMVDVSKVSGTGHFSMRGHTRPPFVTLHGDFLEVGAATPSLGNGPVVAKGSVGNVSLTQAVVSGSLQPARQMRVTLLQK